MKLACCLQQTSMKLACCLQQTSMKQACCLLHAGLLLDLLFNPEDEGNVFLQNIN
jgi:hypothetical protein